MGGVLTILLDIFELAEQLSLSTGFTVDAILSGEAIAAATTEAAWLIEIEAVDVAGLGALEALTLTGLSAEEFSLLSALPTALNNAIGIGIFFQTVTGASAVVAAGVTTFGYSKEVPLVSMALTPWFPQVDYLFPGLSSFSYYLNAALDWGESLFHAVGREIWRNIMRQATQQIGYTSRALAVRGTNEFQHMLAQIAENARWALTNGPIHIYSSVEEYYRGLPSVNPIQLRQQYRSRGELPPTREQFEYQEQVRLRREIGGSEPRSGHYVQHYAAPGGANQRVSQDWMLPLILGLYGDITPTWEKELSKLEKEEYGPPKKKARVRSMSCKKNLSNTRSRSQTPCQRRGRSSRS
ncbi:VP2 protein [Human polyomavirus IPPyV]|uniref:Minor capsid protein n=4 Tax=Human polyomavirus 9 TaxID=943908 RepID=E9NQ88_9POLY|nr:VP2 [Human polyomavirus 9]ADV15631.1 VP2 [Human polyomavirus 9]QCB66179.1 VP2 [Human polyomavirus 9]CBZ41799.1 VP2 protein [Human polyomavirus IPPyV]